MFKKIVKNLLSIIGYFFYNLLAAILMLAIAIVIINIPILFMIILIFLIGLCINELMRSISTYKRRTKCSKNSQKI